MTRVVLEGICHLDERRPVYAYRPGGVLEATADTDVKAVVRGNRDGVYFAVTLDARNLLVECGKKYRVTVEELPA